MISNNQKVIILENYIVECTEAIDKRNIEKAKKLQKELLGVYNSEIKNMTSQLSNYSYGSENVDFINDLLILRAILNNYKATIEESERLRNYELEKLKLQQSITTINNQNNNTASANASSTNTIEISFEQAIKNISNLDNVLNNEEKEELEDKLSSVKTAIDSKDRNKILNKIGNVLKFVTEKGIEVGIAVLPYLGEISKIVSTM